MNTKIPGPGHGPHEGATESHGTRSRVIAGRPYLSERIARVLYEEDGIRSDWTGLSESRRAPWLADADRIIMHLKPLRDALAVARVGLDSIQANTVTDMGIKDTAIAKIDWALADLGWSFAEASALRGAHVAES